MVAGQLAKAELVGVVADALKAQFPAQFLKVEIVALGQRLGHVHAEAGKLHRRIAGDQALGERGQGHGELDGRAGFGARREGQLLVDHGQDAAVGGIDDHGGAVHVAQGVDGRLANHRVFAGRHVAGKDVSAGKGAGGKALVVAMAAGMERWRGAAWRRPWRSSLCATADAGWARADRGPVMSWLRPRAWCLAWAAPRELDECAGSSMCGGDGCGAMGLCQMRFRCLGVMQRVRGVQRRGAQGETAKPANQASPMPKSEDNFIQSTSSQHLDFVPYVCLGGALSGLP